MSSPTLAAIARFQISLNVTDLDRSVRFYRALLAVEPTLHGSQQVRFELADPPLLLTLSPVAHIVPGAINHVGLRLPDSDRLVEVQRRLEEAGQPTQRQDGVECCYARQTKFWVADPDGNLWEIYVLEDDLEHSGFEDVPPPVPVAAARTWSHMLTQPFPGCLPYEDGQLDEVRLEGSLNVRAADWPAGFLAEVRRALRPGGRVIAHGLASDRAIESPCLPGLAALVQRVPSLDEVQKTLRSAGFVGLHFDRLGTVACLQGDDVAFREFGLIGTRPLEPTAASPQRVLYKGPLALVTDEDGTIYRRGEIVAVSAADAERLRTGPCAAQFLVLPSA